ncbi:hypothetical protein Ae201684P_018735 [Aphanomyces euteiches]|nr:hypothetical protein Ae201684P_018735 [Aphanomyces euteiches]
MVVQAIRCLWNLGSSTLARSLHPNKQALHGVFITEPHIWKARVGLFDVALAGHIDNASVVANMEFSRWHASGLSGLAKLVFIERWSFLAGSNMVQYHHDILPGHAFEIHTEVIYWGDAWSFFRHRFVCPTTGKLFIEGVTRTIVKDGQNRTIPFDDVIRYLKVEKARPTEMPDVVKGAMVVHIVRSLWNLGASLLARSLHRNKQALNGLTVTQPHVWKARVGLADLGLGLHINNASVVANMELARWHVSGYLLAADPWLNWYSN